MIWGLGTSFLLILAFLFHNWKRSQFSEVTELKANCLLTSYPLVFIPGKRSLFYFLAYWNEIPHWLASHGYEVFLLPLPWKNQVRRKQALSRFLKEKSKEDLQFHLFIDRSSYQMTKSLLTAEDFECLISVTLVGKENSKDAALSPHWTVPIEELEIPENQSKKPLFWMLHLLWTSQNYSLTQLGWKIDRTQAEFLLERAHFLAERDLLQKQRSPSLEA